MSKPEAGQWWETSKGRRFKIIGQLQKTGHFVLDDNSGIPDWCPPMAIAECTYLPDCTGFDWVVPDQPQPAEDPDEWVVQDRVPVRIGDRGWWENARFPLPLSPEQMVPVDIECDEFKQGLRHGYTEKHLRNATFHVYCRRRDLPKVEQATSSGYKKACEIVAALPPEQRNTLLLSGMSHNPTPRECQPLKPVADHRILGGPHDVCVMQSAEQPEQWPKYYKPSQPRKTGYGKYVAYYKRSETEKGETIHTDGTSFGFTFRAPGVDWTEITEVEAMLLLNKPAEPEPQPQPAKTRVRLWSCDTDGVVVAEDNCPAPGWQEIHHDAEGFYVVE